MKNLISRQINLFFHLLDTTDAPHTIKSISEGISMKGYNLWILICSAMLASIGLDTNSTAVIIGAMLISPLMSPILGVGLGLSINDEEVLFRSLKNLAIAVIASLVTSTLYFLISPLSELTAEEMARTRPNLLDVMVALFGGVAGIVAGSRTEKTNAIPGVAIATALMPPVCTAGYGIAHADWKVFLGAFYLFSINAVFISLATFSVVKYLQFPLKKYVDVAERKRVRNLIYVALLVTLIPSIYFLYTVYQENRQKKIITSEIINQIKKGGNEVLKWEMVKEANLPSPKVKIYYTGSPISDEQILAFKEKMKNNACDNQLFLYRMNLTKDEISEMSTEAVKNLIQTIRSQGADSSAEKSTGELTKELQTLYAPVLDLGMGDVYFSGDKPDTLTSVVIHWKTPPATDELQKISNF